MYIKIILFVGICILFQSGSSLLCSDNSVKGVINCSNGDICFRHEDNVTRFITKGCHAPSVCKNIQDGSQCTTCDTDLCNSGSNKIHLCVIFPVMMILSFFYVTYT